MQEGFWWETMLQFFLKTEPICHHRHCHQRGGGSCDTCLSQKFGVVVVCAELSCGFGGFGGALGGSVVVVVADCTFVTVAEGWGFFVKTLLAKASHISCFLVLGQHFAYFLIVLSDLCLLIAITGQVCISG